MNYRRNIVWLSEIFRRSFVAFLEVSLGSPHYIREVNVDIAVSVVATLQDEHFQIALLIIFHYF